MKKLLLFALEPHYKQFVFSLKEIKNFLTDHLRFNSEIQTQFDTTVVIGTTQTIILKTNNILKAVG